MRVTERARTTDLLRNIQDASERIGALYNKMASQQTVSVPSDDPSRTASIMRISAYLTTLEQTGSSLNQVQAFLGMAVDTLEVCSDTVVQAKTLATRALSGTLSASELNAVGNDINELLESLVQYANQSYDGRYLFAGADTDTTPFTATRDTDGGITAVSYEGAEADKVFPIGRDRRIAGSVTGDAAFVDTGLIQSLISLRDALTNADGLSPQEQETAIRAQFDTLSTAQAGFLALTGEVAARGAEVDALIDQNESLTLRVNETLSKARDVDVAELTVNLQREQLVYEALLASSARIMSISLLDYI